MERRAFLGRTITAAVAAGAAPAWAAAGAGQTPSASVAPRDYYELRRYELRGGEQAKLTHAYVRDALIPAANRLGMQPIGAFNVVIGPLNPSLYVLIPGRSADALAALGEQLDQDAAYRQAGAGFLAAPAAAPAYVRMESVLLRAFQGRPSIQVPPATANRAHRVFELRTYESPSRRDHLRKIEMFHSGEFEIFERVGFHPVFYGDTVIGRRLPNLTYMLAFDRLEDRDKLWAAFGSDPQWKRLTAEPRFAFESIVTNIDNQILSPAAYSQI